MSWFALQNKAFEKALAPKGGVKCVEVFEAAEAFITILDGVDSWVFTPVRNKWILNIDRMKEFHAQHPECKTLEELAELDTGDSDFDEGLLWFTRGAQFLIAAFERNLDDLDESLADSFRAVYEQTLSRHHTFVMSAIFDTALRWSPDRDDFYNSIADDDEEEAHLVAAAQEYLEPFREVQNRVVRLCEEQGWDVSSTAKKRKRETANTTTKKQKTV